MANWLTVDPLSQLLVDAQAGNTYAMEAFVRETQREVWALCRALGDRDNAEDLAQDVYARAFRSLPTYRGDGSARNWLLSIARRTCADSARQRSRWRRWRDDREAPDIVHEDHDELAVDELLAGLDADRREAFVLTQLAGCSYQDAADVLDCPIGTVRSRVARARADLLAAVKATERSA